MVYEMTGQIKIAGRASGWREGECVFNIKLSQVIRKDFTRHGSCGCSTVLIRQRRIKIELWRRVK